MGLESVELEDRPTSASLPDRPPGPLGFVWQIAPYLQPYWLRSAGIVILTLVQVTYYLLLPVAFRRLFDLAVAGPPDGAALWRILSVLAIGYLVVSGAELLQSFWSARLGAQVMSDVRLRLFQHLQKVPYDFYSHTSSGAISTRFTTDLSAADLAVTTSLYKLCFHSVMILASIVLLFVFEWRLALIALVSIPLGAIGPKVFGGYSTRAGGVRQEAEARVVGTVEENIRAQSTIRAFSLQAFSVEGFKANLQWLYEASQRTHVLSAYVEKISALGILLFQLLVIGAGTFLVMYGQLTGGTLLGFMAILVNLGNSARTLTTFVPSLVQATSGMARIAALLGEDPEPETRALTLPDSREGGEIQFNEVSFSYTGVEDEQHLEQITFTIEPGQAVALVGASGSGKSTVLSLIMQFYDSWTGDISINGCDIRSLSKHGLRAQIGVVFQDSFLFDASIRENIRMGRLTASDAEVEAAAQDAEIHDFIIKLPDGYETQVGEGGSRLSGGQRQRLALARALLRAPSILILDEATSALDPATEAAILQTLSRVGQNRTVISVTHRLAAAMQSDRILVFEHGHLVEQGCHEALLNRNGQYAQLWRKQRGVTLSQDGERAAVHVDHLRCLPLLEHMDLPLLQTLSRRFVTEHYAANQIVMRQDEAGDRFFLIVRGAVEVVRVSEEGKDFRLQVLEDGDHFGEIAPLRNVARTATIRTLMSCTFLSLRREHLLDLVAQSPRFKQALEQSLQERIQEC